jgi:hypothetical protein
MIISILPSFHVECNRSLRVGFIATPYLASRLMSCAVNEDGKEGRKQDEEGE